MILDFIKRLLFWSRDAPKTVTSNELEEVFSDLCIRELAFHACVNLVANAVSKCEAKTYVGGKEHRGAEYYLWNYAPNQNQNSSAFWHKLIYYMYRERAALVVENGGKLYVADNWCRQEFALLDDIFTQVTVGDFTFRRSFSASEVLFFELTSKDVRAILDGLYASYSRLIAYGMRGYRKSRGEKGVLELDTNLAGNSEFKKNFDSIRNGEFQKFAEKDDALLPLYRGMKYTSLASKTYNSDTTRDIRSMIDDVTDFYARGFGIPPSLLNGSVQNVDSATNQLLTFCVDPLVDNLQEEINRKRYGFAELRKGNYLEIDTRRIKHIDLLDASSNISGLVGSGVVCINDIRALLGQPLINESWAWGHFVTKNYAVAADMLAAAEKGELSEK
ncbi:MAG: phage portal protein [Oscillospiraceae bacterium]|nr:phage portal protein [Oscillospiraceae bacterium]